jgi:hypothetical protein
MPKIIWAEFVEMKKPPNIVVVLVFALSTFAIILILSEISSFSGLRDRFSHQGPNAVVNSTNVDLFETPENYSFKCPKSLESSYTSNSSQLGQYDLSWCQAAANTHRVVIGQSWGSLPKKDQLKWDSFHCNE